MEESSHGGLGLPPIPLSSFLPSSAPSTALSPPSNLQSPPLHCSDTFPPLPPSNPLKPFPSSGANGTVPHSPLLSGLSSGHLSSPSGPSGSRSSGQVPLLLSCSDQPPPPSSNRVVSPLPSGETSSFSFQGIPLSPASSILSPTYWTAISTSAAPHISLSPSVLTDSVSPPPNTFTSELATASPVIGLGQPGDSQRSFPHCHLPPSPSIPISSSTVLIPSTHPSPPSFSASLSSPHPQPSPNPLSSSAPISAAATVIPTGTTATPLSIGGPAPTTITPKSYASALRSSVSVPEATLPIPPSIGFRSAGTFEGHPAAFFTDEEMDIAAEVFSHSLVLKFSTGNPVLRRLR